MSAVDRPRVVTICGSTRFRAEIAAANRDLTLAGALVLAPGVFAHDGDHIEPGDKTALDALHREKIRMADEVVIVCPRGYYGDSTRREIAYACELGKPLRYRSEAAPAAAPDRTGDRRYAVCLWLTVLALVVLGVPVALAVPALSGYVLLSWVAAALLVGSSAERSSSSRAVSVITQLLSSISARLAGSPVHGEDGR